MGSNSQQIAVVNPAGLAAIRKNMDAIGFWDDTKFRELVSVSNAICDSGIPRESVDIVGTQDGRVKAVLFFNPVGCQRVREVQAARELLDLVALIQRWSTVKP